MKSIYRRPVAEAIFNKAYEQTLQQWEVSYEALQVPTRFGVTHAIAAGPEDGEPLVMLHGFGFSSTLWVDNIKALSNNHRVYAVDFIGDINKSVATRQIETKQDCADWFADVLDGLHIQKTNVMGLSYGGYLALIFALLLPERLRRVIVMSPGASLLPQRKSFLLRCLMAGIFPSANRLNKFMDWMVAKGNIVNASVRNQFIVAMQNCIPRIKVFAAYLPDEELKKIQSPVLLLVGDQDVQYDPRAAIERAVTLIPKLEAELIENAGHGLPMERPDVVNARSLAFLS